MNVRVTWLLPVRNGMPFLTETLASIEAQTYRNWEVLASDGGSTDGSLEELQKWIPSRIPGRIVIDKSVGLGRSLANLVELAETELCARIDADDMNLPNRLQLQVDYMQKHPEISVLGGQMRMLSPEGNDEGPYYFLPMNHNDIVLSFLHLCSLPHPTVMFRRSAVLAAGNYRQVDAEDYDLWLRMAVRHKMANLREYLVSYRIHENSSFRKLAAENRSEQLATDCLCNNAAPLFGCSTTEIRKLKERNHKCTLVRLLRIAWFLKRSQGGSLFNWIGSNGFDRTLEALTSRHDRISAVWRKVRRIAFGAGKEPGLNGL